MSGAGRRAAIVTPYFADHDAVCNDVHHAAKALAGRGWDARVFVVGGASGRQAVHPLAELRSFIRSGEDLVYFHFSTGEAQVLDAVSSAAGRKVLKFHNITPPEFFSMWSDDLAEASRTGRREMARVAAMPWELVLADSAFNLAEIGACVQAGTPRAVLAPFHDTDDLLACGGLPAPVGELPRLLTVGRLAQSKGHPFLLRVMRYLVHDLAMPAVLDIVGKPDHRLLAYWRLLEAMVREFALEPYVSFHGEIPAAALAERYSQAAVFLCASEHEGFCVPIVEAMAFGVPVVALRTTAVPETIGDAGLMWDERDPRRFAVAVMELVRAPEEREWLATQGRRRYAEAFRNAVTEQAFFKALDRPRAGADL